MIDRPCALDRTQTARWSASYSLETLRPDAPPKIIAALTDETGARIALALTESDAAGLAASLRSVARDLDSGHGAHFGGLIDGGAISLEAEPQRIDLAFSLDGERVSVHLASWEPVTIADALQEQARRATLAVAALRRGEVPPRHA
jgi:hypothetical protein